MGDAAPAGLDGQAIENEQIRVLYRHYPLLLLVNALLALIVVLVNRQPVNAAWMDAWLVLMFAVMAARFVSYLRYPWRVGSTPSPVWRRIFVLGTALTGLLWGICAVYTYPDFTMEQRFFMLFILMGLSAGAFTSLTAYMPAFYAFVGPAILPLSAELLAQPELIEIALGGVSLTYVIGLSFFGHNINRALVESLSLRNQNLHLVRELRQKKEQAEQANLDKTRFLAAASHDLRQPLHALSLFVASLRNANRQAGLDDIIRDTAASVRDLQMLFDRLLDISRLDAGILRPDLQDFGAQELLERLVRDYKPAAEAKRLQFEITPCTAWVRSDPILLEQILRNLLANAIRYTDAGEVSLECAERGDVLAITIADTGHGIPKSQHKEVFREFIRLGEARAEGLGLGLAIVKRLATLLEHQLELESEPGTGSRFSVRVPRGRPTAPPPKALQPLALAEDLSGMRVLIIDDEHSILTATAALLGGWGCRVQTALSCEEALLRPAQARPDAIVADYRLSGGMTGVATVARLRALHQPPPAALIITGDTDPVVLREVRDSGFQLLHKPLKPAQLRAFLRSANRRP